MMPTKNYREEVATAYKNVRSVTPLVICMTNYVSMDLMANVLLACGASPAMVSSIEEVKDFTRISNALLINIGTLSPVQVASFKAAAEEAVACGKPWVLDPVGCGATPYRTNICNLMLSYKPTLVRGNASEIIALSGATGDDSIRGVDSTVSSESALMAAKSLAMSHNTVVAVTGKVDYVTDGKYTVAVSNGVEMLTKITATGCSVTALIAAFLGSAKRNVSSNGEALPLTSTQVVDCTASALSVFGLCGERAAASYGTRGPGSTRVALLDELHLLTSDHIFRDAQLTNCGA